MRDIATDPKVAANFVVLLILKLEASGALAASLHTYLPDGSKVASRLCMLQEGAGESKSK
jgi:hypothetical protein